MAILYGALADVPAGVGHRRLRPGVARSVGESTKRNAEMTATYTVNCSILLTDLPLLAAAVNVLGGAWPVRQCSTRRRRRCWRETSNLVSGSRCTTRTSESSPLRRGKQVW